MQELKIEIRKNSFDYEQVKKTENGYIYAQKMNGNTIAYEVFKRKENARFNCISFPSDESFGIWAWTYRTLGQAQLKLNSF